MAATVDSPLTLRLLGSMAVLRGGAPVALPPSRKLRALVAYLALAPRAPTRDQLCELLWTVPGDPRGELRGCLSKIRAALDTAAHRRLLTQGAQVSLDLDGADVDARRVDEAIGNGLHRLDAEALRNLAACFGGDLLDGLEIDHCPQFTAWLLAQRRHFRAAHAAVLEALTARLPVAGDEALAVLARWAQLAPSNNARTACYWRHLAGVARGTTARSTSPRRYAASKQSGSIRVRSWPRGGAHVTRWQRCPRCRRRRGRRSSSRPLPAAPRLP